MGLMAGGAAVNLLGGLFGGRARRKAAEGLARRSQKNISEIRTAGKKYAGDVKETFKGAFEDLANMPTLDVDTEFADQAYSDSKRSAESQYGRSFGEELAKDTARQTTADFLGRARNTGTSTADLLGFLSQAEQGERQSMAEIDYQAIQQRESRIAGSMARLEQAAANRTDFYEGKQMAEYEDKLARGTRMSNFKIEAGTTLADIRNQNRMAIIDAKNQFAQAKAGVQDVRAGNTQALFQGLGSSAMSFGMNQANNEFMMDMYGGGKPPSKPPVRQNTTSRWTTD
jgi:hypothetical protein